MKHDADAFKAIWGHVVNILATLLHFTLHEKDVCFFLQSFSFRAIKLLLCPFLFTQIVIINSLPSCILFLLPFFIYLIRLSYFRIVIVVIFFFFENRARVTY